MRFCRARPSAPPALYSWFWVTMFRAMRKGCGSFSLQTMPLTEADSPLAYCSASAPIASSSVNR